MPDLKNPTRLYNTFPDHEETPGEGRLGLTDTMKTEYHRMQLLDLARESSTPGGEDDGSAWSMHNKYKTGTRRRLIVSYRGERVSSKSDSSLPALVSLLIPNIEFQFRHLDLVRILDAKLVVLPFADLEVEGNIAHELFHGAG